MQHAISTYEEVDTLGRSQVELILKIYNATLGSLTKARRSYQESQWQAGYEEIERARKFVVHLYSTLNFDKGGEVATNLGKMYVYLLSEFDAIEATKNLKHLDSCIVVLTNLRAAWDEIGQSSKRVPGRSGTESRAEAVTAEEPFIVSA